MKDGPTGNVNLTFLKEFGKFAEPAPFGEEAVLPTDEF